MDIGTSLALRAIIHGLRRSGALSPHAMAVIVDELRYAAREAKDALFDGEAAKIDSLAAELQAPDHLDIPMLPVQRVR